MELLYLQKQPKVSLGIYATREGLVGIEFWFPRDAWILESLLLEACGNRASFPGTPNVFLAETGGNWGFTVFSKGKAGLGPSRAPSSPLPRLCLSDTWFWSMSLVVSCLTTW